MHFLFKSYIYFLFIFNSLDTVITMLLTFMPLRYKNNTTTTMKIVYHHPYFKIIRMELVWY